MDIYPMNINRCFAWLAVVALLLTGTPGLGQQPHTKAKFRTTFNHKFAKDSLRRAALQFYDFNNINRVPYYQNTKLLDQIERHQRKGEWEKAYPLLTDYVRNFGIQNFYRDTYLLWSLAKLVEKYDDIEKAKFLYRLVLKHHRGDLNKIVHHYDSLSNFDKDYFVPLEYYYELVEYRKSIDTLRPPVGVLLTMGTEVNSTLADYGPTLGGDNQSLLFTSKRNVRKSGVNGVTHNEDIYYSRKVDTDYWDDASPLKTINTLYNEGSAKLSRDGKTLYFARCESPDSYGNCDIFVAKLQADSTWGEIQNLGPQVNSPSWDSHPALSHSEDTLFFASDRIGGFGLSDLWFTYMQQNGKWAPAQNMGPVINTRQSEVSPFYHPVYDVLYFSSNGQLLNFGDFDIYKCYNINGRWQEPRSIGPLVNGKGSEYYFTIDSHSKDLFYARSEETNLKNLDLFSFPLPMEAQPLSYTKLEGSVKDSITGNPFTGIVSVIDLTSGIEVAPKFLRPNGSYDFDLIKDKNYLVIITGEDFFRIERTFKLVGDTAIHIETPALSLKKWEFASLEFEPGSAKILPTMNGDLNKVVAFLVDHPSFHLKISGHTDSNGDAALNMKLSQRRADAIKKYLVDKGKIAERRIEARGFGNSMPIVEEKSEADRAINRRVEFEIYRPSAANK
ncbi:MAG: Outer membrane lipoprotein omp16 precursor [uncultured Cytophagales bacterium]|uniref:Outer membrane lipoprotein omp16 n=1 Tax=uncultured Cytophagales bacterium TaxID=158755 RepID=A0A6J4JRB1_9SPHI|nr:MAG: Outer membrane lipoprotein omp16 precursor [uncultured Cytophagales bacterium]